MTKYQASTLDVWGNEEEGYEINNSYNYQVIDEEELDDFKAFCEEHLRGDPDQYEIDSCSTESFYEIRVESTGYPVLHLQKIYEEEEEEEGPTTLTPFFTTTPKKEGI